MTCRALPWFLIAATIGCTGCSPERSMPAEAREPLIMFGIDGLEWSVMQPLLAEGRLPAIAGLMARGTFGYLDSMLPTLSPVIWTSIATGKTMEQHGIRHFVYTERGAAGEIIRYYTSGHREAKAFWNILSEYGLDVHCFGWWITYPAEPINGVMVTQTNTTAILKDPNNALWKGSLLRGVEGQVHPRDRQNQVMSVLEAVDASLDKITKAIFGELKHPTTALSQRLWDHTLWAFRADAVYIRVAAQIVEEAKPFDLAAVYIGGPDVSAHRFWRFAYPQEYRYPPALEQLENFGRIINDHYEYVDRSIGEMIAAAPPNTTVMILSDHGMHAINQERMFLESDPAMRANSAHHLDAPPGVFIAAGPHIHDGPATSENVHALDLNTLTTVGDVLDVLPTLLALKAVPLAEDLAGELMAEVVEEDWLARFPLRTVTTHDDASWDQARHERMPAAIDQNERLEQLRSLGYIK